MRIFHIFHCKMNGHNVGNYKRIYENHYNNKIGKMSYKLKESFGPSGQELFTWLWIKLDLESSVKKHALWSASLRIGDACKYFDA